MRSFDEKQVFNCDFNRFKDSLNLWSLSNEDLIENVGQVGWFFKQKILRVDYLFQGCLIIFSFPDFVYEKKFLLMKWFNNFLQFLLNFIQGVDSPSNIDETVLEQFGHIELVWFMIIVIKLKLLFLIYSSFQELTVYFLLWLYFLYNCHGPAVNNEYGILRKRK